MQWLFLKWPRKFTAKFEAAIEGLDDFLDFADLLGGTPCNVVEPFDHGRSRRKALRRMNLPMVIEFINANCSPGADADYKAVLKAL